MIQSVNLSTTSVGVGQPFTLAVYADAPISVSIACFVEDPPPPRFQGCPECSVQTVRSGQMLQITAEPDTWRNKSGRYRIAITDASGDHQEVLVEVVKVDVPRGSPITA